MNNPITMLQRALTANAAFSALTGLAALTFAGRLSGALGPPDWSLRALGAGLLIFAALVARESMAPGRSGTIPIIAADLAWVVSATIVLVSAPSWLADTGRITLATVSLVVAAVAVAQWRGLQNAGSP